MTRGPQPEASSTPEEGERAYRILLAEDEASLRDLLRLSLEHVGYQVLLAEDGQQAIELFNAQPVDLVVLDVIMPRLDGFAVCRYIRERSDVPIIMLTALSDTEHLVRGLELGADDYLAKPFTFREMEARIQALLRRVEWGRNGASSRFLSVGRITLDLESHKVFVDGRPCQLTPMEFRLLHYLMAHPGRTIPKAMLFREVWGYKWAGETNLVEVGIHRLREKIEEDPARPTHIQTIWGRGYRFQVS